MVHYGEIQVRTRERAHWVDITPDVRNVVARCGVTDGIASITSLHTTAGITINENADPDVAKDFFWKLGQMVPKDSSYRHVEGNSDSHLKASLVGLSTQVAVRRGDLVLGTWQSIYFCEFDGPRNRRVSVSVVGE